MKRLTVTFCDGSHGAADNLPCGENSYQYKKLLLEALGKYEDAAEKGLLIHLPCKVGDIVYKPNPITRNEVVGIKIESISLTESGINISGRTTIKKYSFYCKPEDFGETVFLTFEEAEAVIKRLNVKSALADAETDYDR